MKVKQLIEQLSKLDPELKVFIHVDEEECDARISHVEKTTEPKYVKADDLLEVGAIKEDEEFVYIVGDVI